MKFRTAYDYSERFPCPSGTRYRRRLVRGVASDGSPTLIEDGKEDVYDSIQKSVSGRSIEDLIRRATAGDNTAIPPVVDSYPDLSSVPTSMLEAHMMLEDAKLKYNSLPAELRSKYGNDFSSFLSAAASGQILQDITGPAENNFSLSSDEVAKLKALISGGTNE